MEKRQRRKWRSNDRAWIRNKLTAAKDASIPIARLKRFTSDGTRTFAAWPPLVRWSATIGPTKPGVCISDSWNCGIFCGRGKSFFNNCSPPRTASSEPSPRRKKKYRGRLLVHPSGNLSRGSIVGTFNYLEILLTRLSRHDYRTIVSVVVHWQPIHYNELNFRKGFF